MLQKKRSICSNELGSGYSMNMDDGDSLFATKTPLGYQISAYDPNFVRKIEAARRGMKRYQNALVELSK